MMQTLTHRFVKAKKEHICDLCHGKIEPGTVYEYQFNVDGGESWEFKAHRECVEIAVELDAFYDEGVTEDSFYDALSEAVRDMLTEEEQYEGVTLSVCEMVNRYLQTKEVTT